jgi:hypothetical protein
MKPSDDLVMPALVSFVAWPIFESSEELPLPPNPKKDVRPLNIFVSPAGALALEAGAEEEDDDGDEYAFNSDSRVSKSPKLMFELCGADFLLVFINNSIPPPKLLLPLS